MGRERCDDDRNRAVIPPFALKHQIAVPLEDLDRGLQRCTHTPFGDVLDVRPRFDCQPSHRFTKANVRLCIVINKPAQFVTLILYFYALICFNLARRRVVALLKMIVEFSVAVTQLLKFRTLHFH